MRPLSTGLFAAISLAVTFGLSACGDADTGASGPGRAGPPAARIVPHEITFARDARKVEVVGTARARLATTVTPEVNGRVNAVRFEAGDFVEAGKALVELDAEDEKLAVNLARVAVREAQQLLDRYRRIEDTGAVSDSAIDEARTALEAAKIRLQQSELALEDRTVRAPFAGYLGLSAVDPGARVSPDLAITQLDDRRVLYIDFAVPEDVFGAMQIGDTIGMRSFSAGDEAEVDGELIGLDSRINPQSRAFTARAAIDNSSDRWRPGMSFAVAFDVPGDAYPLVPEAAIVWGSDGAYLWAVEDQKAKRVRVALVSRREGFVLVNAPLEEGDLIIAEGVQKVRDDMPVQFERSNTPEPQTQRRPTSAGGADAQAAQ